MRHERIYGTCSSFSLVDVSLVELARCIIQERKKREWSYGFVGTDPPPGCKLTLGYKEDAQDLRSSTEELDLQDPVHEQDLKRESKRRKRREADGTQSDYGGRQVDRERKDSNCSEICLLNISGRTSRLSSVGSQGSGVSGKLSVVSATSSR